MWIGCLCKKAVVYITHQTINHTKFCSYQTQNWTWKGEKQVKAEYCVYFTVRYYKLNNQYLWTQNNCLSELSKIQTIYLWLLMLCIMVWEDETIADVYWWDEWLTRLRGLRMTQAILYAMSEHFEVKGYLLYSLSKLLTDMTVTEHN